METQYLEFSKMSNKEEEAYKIQLKKMYESDAVLGLKLEKPFNNFNENGLKYTTDYLSKLSVNIVFLPIEIMQEFVDEVTKEAVDNGNWLFLDAIPIDYNTLDIAITNATGIGNLAYIILNASNEPLQHKCKKALDILYSQYCYIIQTQNK